MLCYSKDFLTYGKANIRGETFDFSFADDVFSFFPKEDLSKKYTWKRLTEKELSELSIICIPYGEKNLVAEIIGTYDTYIAHDHSLRCNYQKLFIRHENCRIDALAFRGPTIDQIVQNLTVRNKLEDGINPLDLTLKTSFNVFGKICDLSTVTRLNNDDSTSIGYSSSVFLHFDTSVSTEQAFLVYDAFIRLVYFLGYRKDVFLECNSYKIEGKGVFSNGTLYLPHISKNNLNDTSRLISLEAIMPVIGGLINYILDGNIIPLFIPAKKGPSFSDSYILATAWAQMVFKQVYVPINPNYRLNKYDVIDFPSKSKVTLEKQLSIMIEETFPYLSDFLEVSSSCIISGVDIHHYICTDLPKRLKTVRHAIAHGSNQPKDYEYTHLDMIVLLCAIYYSILKKKLGLDEFHLEFALSELFCDRTEVSSQWSKLHHNT